MPWNGEGTEIPLLFFDFFSPHIFTIKTVLDNYYPQQLCAKKSYAII